jgi:hypothetical protein
MRFRAGWLVLAVVLPAGAAEDRYTIKIKNYPDVGQGIAHRETDRQSSVIRVLNSDGKVVQENKPVEVSEEQYTTTILEMGDNWPTRYRRVYDKAVFGNGTESKQRSYQGRSILFEFRQGKFNLKVEDKGMVSKGDLHALAVRAAGEVFSGLDEVFLPGRAVKIDESWPVDGKVLMRGFGDNGKLDLAKSSGQAKLVKVYSKDGMQFGIIEFDLKLAYPSMDDFTFDPPALFEVNGTLETAIDGSSAAGTLKVTTKLSGKTETKQKDMKLTVELLREGTSQKERTAAK